MSQAIYPALIVVLVALDRSHIEKAFVDGLKDRRALDAWTFQLDPGIALETNLNAALPGENENSPVARPGILVGSDSGDSGSGSGGTSTCGSGLGSDRQKLEGMV